MKELDEVALRIGDERHPHPGFRRGEVVCWWRYTSMGDAIRGLLCSAGGARAREAAGEHAVRGVLRRALESFRDPRTGVVSLENTFRWVAACR